MAQETVELQVTMRHSPSLCALAEALALAQGEFPAIEKERTAKVESKKGEASSYSYSYADLADILAAVRKPLSSHGLAVVQPIAWTPQGQPWLITRLLHSSGEWLESLYRLVEYERPQDMGSAITYARRYALTALLGIAAEEDDDGQAAQRGATDRASAKAPCPKCKDGRKVIKSKFGPGLYCLQCKVNFPDPTESPVTAEVVETSDGRTFEVDDRGQLDPHKPALPADGSPAWKDPMALGAECMRLSGGNKVEAAKLLAQVTAGKITVKGMAPSEVLAGWSRLADVMAVRAQ